MAQSDFTPDSAAAPLVARALAIITVPAREWPVIAAEGSTSREILTRYVFPLALVGPVCGFIGGRLFGTERYGALANPGFGTELLGAAIALVLSLITYLILNLIADNLAPRFGGRHDSLGAAKLVAYGSTPVWLAGILALVPALTPLSVLALWSLYLVYKGAGPVMGVPAHRTLGYTVTFAICGLILNGAVMALSVANLLVLRGMGLTG